LAALAQTSGAPAGEAVRLRPGAYEVEFRLELPNLDNATERRSAALCITAPDAAGSQGLAVLSENNPLGRCPVSALATEGTDLVFEIVCPGGNAARGRARFTLAPEAFRGHIAMTMGGKNMTMTEIQTGRRTGDCPAHGAPRS